MIGNFNEEAQNILIKAKKEMYDLGHPYVGTEHLLLALLNNDYEISKRLKEYNITYDNFKTELCKIIGTTSKKSDFFLYTPLLRKIISSSIIDSKENNDGEVTPEHLLFAMLEEGEGIAIRILIGMDVDMESLYDDFSVSLIKKRTKDKNKKLLIYELGYDMTEKAKNGELDPVIGRDREVRRIMEILCRRTKNNPILIGEAGVGKTAIVEELSRLIADDNVPGNLSNKKIISLDMATMVSGTKYRGEFEERMKKVIKELEDNQDIILFIDEIHTLVGAGGAEGAIDASNILKPALARGKIRCIGATTTDEYKKYIEKDSALERRFQKVNILEPSIEETKNILVKLKPIYEKFHNVIISFDMIDKIIEYSEKYIFDRNRPDKEIDVLDEVCSRASIKGSKNVDRIKNIKKKIFKLGEEKNNYIIDNNVIKAYGIRKKETKLLSILNDIELSNKENINHVKIKDIISVIESKTDIPIYDMNNDGLHRLTDIPNLLKKNIIGQDNIIDNLSNIAKRIKFGSLNRCYSCLFVGSSGVGKSALAKLFATLLVGENNFIRLDMSEFSDGTSVNKILGSSPGYVGYDDNINVLEKIRSNPNCVLLLDEIDKAHSSVINLFYQILEENEIKDSKGRIIRFNNVIILMTSNAGYEKNKIGFNKTNISSCELKNYFDSAFINRIDNILFFNSLTEDNLKNIINIKLELIRNKYPSINIEINDKVVDEIIEKSNFIEFGARRINKILSDYIENVIIDGIIANKPNVIIDTLDKYKKDITRV